MTPSDGRVENGRIEIRGLRIMGTHGLLAEERTRAQPFEVDLDASLDLRAAAVSDDLADTVDYGDLVGIVVAVVSGPRFDLLEALTGAVARSILARDDRLEEVVVTIRKLRPPVPHHLESAGVTIRHRRADHRRAADADGGSAVAARADAAEPA
jgi:7,8-dihydroneopterin aldolase/epimerase/oxygenase